MTIVGYAEPFEQEQRALVQNALHELEDLRSDIISELTGPFNSYLQIRFVTGVDVARDALRKALK